MEAARFGAKIFHGPDVSNFKEIYRLLKLFKVSKKITTPKQLAYSISFKKNRKSPEKIKNIGKTILKKTIIEIENLINNEFKKT